MPKHASYEKVESLTNAYKEMFLDKSSEIYLYDLELATTTVNQSIAVDEVSQTIFATQATTLGADKYESFILSRLSLGGKLLDSMTVKLGGHGTSIGVENENGQVYIWSNMIRVDGSGNLVTQFLARFPYAAGAEINVDSPSVERFIEFPDPYNYMTPFTDAKNGLIAIRKTNSTSGVISKVEVMKLSEVKAGTNTILHSYDFTSEMNSLTLQGLTLDGNDLYISFANSASNFKLFRVDVSTSEIVETIDRPIALNASGVYDSDFSEPEGLYLYTDPNTLHKTLLAVVVMDLAGRRRQKLFAFSWNAGVQKFLGFSNERSQKVKLTRDDGKAKRLPSGTTSLQSVIEPGHYYMISSETANLTDHPFPGIAGWYMTVTASDTTGIARVQTLTRNSLDYEIKLQRNVDSNNVAGEWLGVPIPPTFENGWGNYYVDGTHTLKYYKTSTNQVVIRGIVSNTDIASVTTIFTLPVGYRPDCRHAFVCKGSGNTLIELLVDTDGSVKVTRYMSATNSSYVFINCVVSLL